MKTLVFLAVGTLFSIRALSQDTLFTRNGEMIAGKVMEINADEIKYKKSSNPDGPLYTARKSDIVVIEYQNGSRDVFSTQADTQGNNNSNNNNNNNSYSQQPAPAYVNTRPALNVVIGALPFFGGYMPWGWGGGWGGWGWGRPYYGGNYGYRYGGYHHYGGGGFGGGHYGRRGGHR